MNRLSIKRWRVLEFRLFDIIVSRSGGRTVGFELTGDAAEVLGPLHAEEGELDWE